MKKITKREKRRILQIILGIIGFSLLSPPIDTFIDSLFQTNSARFTIGIIFLLIVAFMGKLEL